jgi:hypothetical protein
MYAKWHIHCGNWLPSREERWLTVVGRFPAEVLVVALFFLVQGFWLLVRPEGAIRLRRSLLSRPARDKDERPVSDLDRAMAQVTGLLSILAAIIVVIITLST